MPGRRLKSGSWQRFRSGTGLAGSGRCIGPIAPNCSWGGSRSLPSKAHGRFSGGLVGDAPVLERGATRAADFAKGWQDATYGRGETQSFYKETLENLKVDPPRILTSLSQQGFSKRRDWSRGVFPVFP